MFKDELKNIQNATTRKHIYKILEKFSNEYGFKYFTYARVFPNGISAFKHIAIGNFPAEWLEKYHECQYVSIDPVVKHCSSSVLPYIWKNVFKSQNKDIIKFAFECTSIGLKEGFSLGTNGSYGDLSVLSFGGSRDINYHLVEPSQAVITAHLLLPYLHEKLLLLEPIFNVKRKGDEIYSYSSISKLTNRETECLMWSSEGKTACEIATILAISKATVDFHLKNSVSKLDCSNKTHAVAKAVKLGLIVR